MNVPRKTPTDAINSHGEPCIIKIIPQLMKKVNTRNVRMAKENFIAVYCSVFSFRRKRPAVAVLALTGLISLCQSAPAVPPFAP